MRVKVAEMRKKRADLIARSRAFLDRVEGRELTAEEEGQWQAMQAEIDDLGRRVERIERQLEIESEIIEPDEDEPEFDPEDEEDREDDEDDEDEEEGQRSGRRRGRRFRGRIGERRGRRDSRARERREAFWKLMRGESLPAQELRALAIGTDTAGGYTVPDEFVRQLIKKLEDENVMRRLATVRQSESGESQIPVESDIGLATWTGENAAYTESDVTFGQVLIGAHKLSRITKVSEELLQDSYLSMEEYLADVFGRSFGRAEEAAFVAGTGAGRPSGVVQASQKGTDAAPTALAADDLFNLFHGLRRPYREAASFLMADTTALLVRKLKDETGQYLWQPGLQAGKPDTLIGRPVFISDHVPAVGEGAKAVLFGDFAHYWIVDRKGRTMQRLVERYADNGQVGFRMFQRVDGKLTLPEAVVHLIHGTS